MRTKALMLGAKTRPCEGAWVPIGEAERWSCRVEGFPIPRDFRDSIDLEIQTHNGEIIVLPAFDEFAGKKVRVIVRDVIEGVSLMSVFAEAVT